MNYESRYRFISILNEDSPCIFEKCKASATQYFVEQILKSMCSPN